MVARLDEPRTEPQSVALVRAQQLDLARVEAELVQPAQPLFQPEALVAREHLLVRQLGPQPVVARDHLLRELERVLVADVEQLAVEVLARDREIVRPLPVGELLVHLGRLGVDEVGGELAGVAAEERVRQRAVAPEEPGEVQAHEQLRERVEQEIERRRENRARQHEPVRQRVVEVTREQHRLLARPRALTTPTASTAGRPSSASARSSRYSRCARRGGSSFSA